MTLISIFRSLKTNNWDCPIIDYSGIVFNDYVSTKSECGKKWMK